jgi:UDP-galactopyranose mutase
MYARHYAEIGRNVLVLEKRNHIAGNLYDFFNEKNILVQKYGPHCFHTNSDEVINYIKNFSEWYPYAVNCNVFMHGIYTPSPFNFKTIDQFYSREKALQIKNALSVAYPGEKSVPIVELLSSENELIKEYAEFLYNSDYSLYTANGILFNLFYTKLLQQPNFI